MKFHWPVNVRLALWLCIAASFAVAPTIPVAIAEDALTTLIGEQATAFQSGYILPKEEVVASVVGSRDSRTLFASGDLVYLKLAPGATLRMNDRVTLYRPTTVVFHPVTKVMMGRVIKVLGVLEVIRPPVNQVVEAKVVKAFDSMMLGDPVMPFTPPPTVPAQSISQTSLPGFIVEFQERREVTAQGDIVYLDRGSKDGVALGDRFQVTRRGRQTLAALPSVALGELKVIGLQEWTSTARVVESSDALRRGDSVSRLPGDKMLSKETGDDVAKNEERVVNALAAAAPTEPKPRDNKKQLQSVYFEFNKWVVADDKDLSQTAALLKEQPSAKVLIEGHADERGTREYNLILAEKRAKEIQRQLVTLGLKNPMSVQSYGKERPACTEDTEACHAKNRRVGLVLDAE